MAEGTLTVRVVSPEKVVFEGEASAVVAPAWDGKVGILPGHAPFLTLLGAGSLDLEIPGGGSRRFHVAAGAMKVEGDEVTLLSEYADLNPPEEIPPEAIIHPEDVLAVAVNPLI
ncbi:MAG: ATP synthase F1 subunit epsilon [Gemmatimonadota bacterium]